jgi:hypothetical protein
MAAAAQSLLLLVYKIKNGSPKLNDARLPTETTQR